MLKPETNVCGLGDLTGYLIGACWSVLHVDLRSKGKPDVINPH